MNLNFDELKTTIEEQAAAHPWQAVGIAVAAGAVMGLLGGGKKAPDVKRGVGGTVVAALGAVAMRLIKDAAFRQVAGYAKEWLANQEGLQGTASRENLSSHDGSIEAFLEH